MKASVRRLVPALAALPLMTGAASAATAISSADAEGLVGEGGAVETTTASLSQVNVAGVATAGESASTLFKSLAVAQSSTVTTGGMTLQSPPTSPPPPSPPPPPPIPEPETWALMLIGVGALGAALRRLHTETPDELA
jgi:hypothetical protein